MSRHRGAYTDDDLYDYDDDDYDDGYYDDDYAHEEGAPASHGGSSAPKGSAKEYVLFVMESLGAVEVTPSGSRVVGGISEARVLQMLDAYDCDVERTIDYFLTQRQKAVAPAPAAVAPPKPPPGKSGAGGGMAGSKGAATGPGKGPQKPLPSAGAAAPSVSSLDVSAMGLTGGADPAVSGDSAATAASKLLVASAPLSDDDESDVPAAATAAAAGGPSLPHLTLVVAGHVDAGKSTLVGNLLYKVPQRLWETQTHVLGCFTPCMLFRSGGVGGSAHDPQVRKRGQRARERVVRARVGDGREPVGTRARRDHRPRGTHIEDGPSPFHGVGRPGPPRFHPEHDIGRRAG